MALVTNIYMDNSNDVVLSNLKLSATGRAITSAVVTVRVLDSSGVPLVGPIWPLTMTLVPNSNGAYRVTLPFNLPLIESEEYTAEVTATDSVTSAKAVINLPLKATVRTKS